MTSPVTAAQVDQNKVAPAALRWVSVAMPICAVFLVMGMGPMPLPYYRMLRIVVPACFLLIARAAYARSFHLPLVIGLCMALLFNPLLPVADDRGTWTVLDMLALAGLAYVSDAMPTDSKRRSLGLAVMMGTALFPPVFAWFSLRGGHSRLQRLVSFGWLAAWTPYIMLIVYLTGPHELHLGNYVIETGGSR